MLAQTARRAATAAAAHSLRPSATSLPQRLFHNGPVGTDATEEMKKLRFITAIKTPFLENGKFDLKAFDHLAETQIANGVEGFIIGGTTGEGQLMWWDEHIMLIAHAVNCFGDRVKIVGNTGSNSTGEAIHASEQGFAVGMHAALHINPYYGKTSETGVLRHLNESMAYGPTIVYNVPGRTAQDLPPHLVHELAEHEHFIGMKECMGFERIQGYAERGIQCWSGNDDDCHDTRHHAGGRGVISVTGNVIPGIFSRLMHGEAPDPELNDRVKDLVAWLFCEPNPIALNTALAMMGLCKPVFRLPYMPLSRAQREEGKRLLDAVGIENLPAGVEEVRVMEDDEFILISRF